MTDYGLPILATLALWWGSTGAIFYVDNLPARTFRYTMIGGDGARRVRALGPRRHRGRHVVGRRLWRVLLWPDLLGMADRQLLHRLRDRAAQHALPARIARAHALHRGGAHEPLSRIVRAGRRGRAARDHARQAQPTRLLDLCDAVVDARERQAQRVLRRAQSRRGNAARASALSRQLHDAPADEHVLPVLGHHLDGRHDVAGDAPSLRRRRSKRRASPCWRR